MDTNSSTLIQKKFIKVDVAHLDKKGYGPGGEFTRQAWRDECLNHLKAGKNDFLAWQNSWIEREANENNIVSFESKIHFDDGSSVSPYVEHTHRSSLDFIGRSFNNCDIAGFTFLQNTIFASTNFFGVTNFEEANFNKFVTFERAHFEEMAWFNKTVFSQDVNFSKTIFSGDAWFSGATFRASAIFVNVRFHSLCNFAHFYGSKIKSINATQGALFEGYANFRNSIFENIGDFNGVRFKTRTPNFVGSKIGETRLEFSNDSYFPSDENGEDAVKCISFLKRLADEHGQTDQALNFNAMELRAKALSKGASFNFKLITWFYNHISDFGRSFARPLGVYVFLLFLTFLFALEHSAYNSPRNYTQHGCEKYIWWIERVSWIEDKNCLDKTNVLQLTGFRAASEYTLYRAAGVLDFSDNGKATDAVANRLFGQSIEPWWMRVWGVFKAIASTALLFLAALGLRNKYRIK